MIMIKNQLILMASLFRKHSAKGTGEQNCTGADDHNDTCMTESLELGFASYLHSYILY